MNQIIIWVAISIVAIVIYLCLRSKYKLPEEKAKVALKEEFKKQGLMFETLEIKKCSDRGPFPAVTFYPVIIQVFGLYLAYTNSYYRIRATEKGGETINYHARLQSIFRWILGVHIKKIN